MINNLKENKEHLFDDLNILLEDLTRSNRQASVLFGLDAPLPYSSVRRKLELKRRRDVFRKALLRDKQKRRIASKKRRRELIKLRVQKYRARGNSFVEKARYYESLEKSYWYYLKRKYGTKRILTLEEFEEHIAPHYLPGTSVLERIDKQRKDFFLDNIRVVNDAKSLQGSS